MHEDNVKRTYPLHDNGETRDKNNASTSRSISVFFSEDTDDDSSSMESSIEENQNRTLTPTNIEHHTQHKYNLQSISNVPDLSRIMSKPVEYT